MNIRTAKSIPLAAYLSGLGFELVKRRGADLWYLSPLRKERRASFKVNTHLNTWFDFEKPSDSTNIYTCTFRYPHSLYPLVNKTLL